VNLIAASYHSMLRKRETKTSVERQDYEKNEIMLSHAFTGSFSCDGQNAVKSLILSLKSFGVEF
jgi:hypothetical protein